MKIIASECLVMKRALSLVLGFALVFLVAGVLAGCSSGSTTDTSTAESTTTETAEQVTLVLASTTSTQDSGLFDVLIPAFEEANPGITVQVIAVGTGEALQKGIDGDADVLLVHAKADEEQFVADGYGTYRKDVMYNDFIIVGPADDPAGIKDCATAAEALAKIAESGSIFISRGDDSGTNKKELKIWESAGIEPSGDWYEVSGQGMGETLKIADEKQAYTLADRATYLSMFKENAIELSVNFEGASDLLNQYGVIPVTSAQEPEAAELFADWITSDEGQEVIANYGIEEYGEALFTPNAS